MSVAVHILAGMALAPMGVAAKGPCRSAFHTTPCESPPPERGRARGLHVPAWEPPDGGRWSRCGWCRQGGRRLCPQSRRFIESIPQEVAGFHANGSQHGGGTRTRAQGVRWTGRPGASQLVVNTCLRTVAVVARQTGRGGASGGAGEIQSPRGREWTTNRRRRRCSGGSRASQIGAVAVM